MDSAHVRIRRSTARLTAQTLDEVAAFAVHSIGSAQVSRLTVQIAQHVQPRGWVGFPGLHGLCAAAMTPRASGVEATVSVEKPRDISVLTSAIVRMLTPVRGPRGTFTSALPDTATMLAPSIRDVYTGDVHEHLRRADDSFGEHVIDAMRHIAPRPDGRWAVDGRSHDVWVDPRVHRPLGRPSITDVVIADLPRGPWLTSQDVAALQTVSAVRGYPSAVLQAQLHASGVLLEAELPEDDPYAAQIASVRARRQAYREFSWPTALDTWPTVTAVLVTNRVTHLDTILSSIRRFTYPRLQLVIGLHGIEASPETVPGIDTRIVHLDAALPFGAAMQLACNAADGDLITKIDDDDVYGPEHIWDLVIAKLYSGAQIVGKALDWIYLADEGTTVFRPVYSAEKYGKFVAGGTIMIDKGSLAEVGGWRPVPKSIDRALLESVRGSGGLVYRTHGLGYMYVRRASGHTAQVDNAHFRTRTHGVFEGRYSHAEFGTG